MKSAGTGSGRSCGRSGSEYVRWILGFPSREDRTMTMVY